MSPQVLLLGAPSGLDDALRAAGADPVVATDADDVPGPTIGVAAIVLGGIEAGLTVAQRVGRSDNRLPVLILEAPQGLEDARARIQTAPFVGRNTRAMDSSAPLEQTAAAIIAEAARYQQWSVHAHRVRELASDQVPLALADHRMASRYLGQLVEHAPIGVVTLDPDGVIQGWNPVATELVGRRERDAVGSPFHSLFPEDAARQLDQLVTQALTSPTSCSGTFQRRSPLGDDQHLELTLASLDDGLGRLGTMVLVQDVTTRLRDESTLRARAREAMLAAAIGAAVTGPEPLRTKLGKCTDAVVDHLNVAFARIWILDASEDVLHLEASSGLYTHLDGEHSRIAVGSFKIGRIAARQRPHLTNDVLNDREISDPEWARRERMVSFAGYPLCAGDHLWGVLALFGREPLPPATLDALAAVADTIAVGIQQARSEEEIERLLTAEQAARLRAEEASRRHASLAQTLQQSLLPPRLPLVAGLEAAARYRWAGVGDEIGGDFYDLLHLDDDRWCAVLGDISGKGVGAARATALVRYTLRAAARSEPDLPALAGVLNEALLEDSLDRYCTLVLAAGHADQPGTVSLLLAGHPYPLLVHRDGTWTEVGVPNLPVGMFADATFEPSTVEVPTGSTLLLFSDGLVDVRRPDGSFDSNLLAETLPRLTGADPESLTAGLEAEAVRRQSGRPHDDIAILALVPR